MSLSMFTIDYSNLSQDDANRLIEYLEKICWTTENNWKKRIYKVTVESGNISAFRNAPHLDSCKLIQD